MSGFDRYLGGSPANIAVGLARLGARVGMISAVSTDPLGDYVCQTLAKEGVDTGGVVRVGEPHRTSLALTEMRADDCRVLLYRNGAADLALTVDDLAHEQLVQCRLLIVSGTALSQSPSREAAMAAMQMARSAGGAVLLDLDYRPYSWASEIEAAEVYQSAARACHMLVGNCEEFAVLGADVTRGAAAVAADLRRGDTACVVVKDGARGSWIDSTEGHWSQPAFRVQARKPFGAGDAFAAALCAGLLNGLPLADSVRRGSAAAALVVMGHACSDASPTPDQLEAFLAAQPERCHAQAH